MAFGTGLHPTTRLCLAGARGRSPTAALVDGARVLDVGCGSGILAIAAAKLGAASVLGVDTDPIAIEATIANAAPERARRPDRRPGRQPAVRATPPHDVVLANLIASVLIALARPLRDELAPGGTLLASGIFVDREAEVRAAFEAVGLDVTARTAEGEWVALEAVRRRGPQCRAAYNRADARRGSRSCSSTHIVLAVSLFLPSILLPFALRTRRAAAESPNAPRPVPALDAGPRDAAHRARAWR